MEKKEGRKKKTLGRHQGTDRQTLRKQESKTYRMIER